MQMETLVWKESVWHRSTIVDQQAEADPRGKGWEGPLSCPPNDKVSTIEDLQEDKVQRNNYAVRQIR